MIPRIGVILFVIIFCSSLIQAQDKIILNGIIIDQQSKQPLPHANIQIFNTFKGSISNTDGEFEIHLESHEQILEFSYIGYETKTIKADLVKNPVLVELIPKPVEGETIQVYAYNWVERFILEAIAGKNHFKDRLEYYKALAYSKTSFSSADSNKLFAMVEAISNIYYQAPDTYKETVLNLQMPPHMKNVPYQALAINQNTDVYNERIKAHRFSIISPLNDNALDYYEYKLSGQFFSGTDTVICIKVAPKNSKMILLSGELFFKKQTHQLLEAKLFGNNSVKDGTADSLSLFLKYRTDSIFTLPVFAKLKLQMNFMGILYNYTQENSFIDHSINDTQNKPFINLDQLVTIEPNLNYDIDLKRDEVFRIPLSDVEREHKKTIDRVFINAPFYRRALLFLFTDLLPLTYDQPGSIGNLKINKFSNWYHFNKVEGHFLGLEYQVLNNDLFNIFAQGGYSFERETISYDIRSRYKGLTLQLKDRICNLGGFDYNKTGQSLSALFSHEDDMHYYHSVENSIYYTHDLFSHFSVNTGVVFEYQRPVKNRTDFSISNSSESYLPNFLIQKYHNNKAGITINYIENHDYINNHPVLYHGEAFTNFSVSYYRQDEQVLEATEDRAIVNIDLRHFHPVIYPMSVDFKLNWHKQDKSDYINEMNFINQKKTIFEKESSLEYFTLDNYDFYVRDYLHLTCDLTLFNLPKIYTLRMSVGGFASYLKPYNIPSFDTIYFEALDEELWEYGIAIKSISVLNLYIVTNNLADNKIYFRLKMDL